jgi:hypothetical protein
MTKIWIRLGTPVLLFGGAISYGVWEASFVTVAGGAALLLLYGVMGWRTVVVAKRQLPGPRAFTLYDRRGRRGLRLELGSLKPQTAKRPKPLGGGISSSVWSALAGLGPAARAYEHPEMLKFLHHVEYGEFVLERFSALQSITPAIRAALESMSVGQFKEFAESLHLAKETGGAGWSQMAAEVAALANGAEVGDSADGIAEAFHVPDVIFAPLSATLTVLKYTTLAGEGMHPGRATSYAAAEITARTVGTTVFAKLGAALGTMIAGPFGAVAGLLVGGWAGSRGGKEAANVVKRSVGLDPARREFQAKKHVLEQRLREEEAVRKPEIDRIYASQQQEYLGWQRQAWRDQVEQLSHLQDRWLLAAWEFLETLPECFHEAALSLTREHRVTAPAFGRRFGWWDGCVPAVAERLAHGWLRDARRRLDAVQESTVRALAQARADRDPATGLLQIQRVFSAIDLADTKIEHAIGDLESQERAVRAAAETQLRRHHEVLLQLQSRARYAYLEACAPILCEIAEAVEWEREEAARAKRRLDLEERACS